MTTLKEMIEAKLILDEASIHRESDRIYYGSNAITWREGARWQHDQLKSEVLPILLECVEVLENAKMCLADRLSRNKAPEPYMIVDIHQALERLRKWSEGG